MKCSNCLSLVVLVLIFSLFAPLSAEQIVELDLDGIPGNGPDTAFVAVGESFPVDVWLRGEGIFFGCGALVCQSVGGLIFESVDFHTSWFVSTVQFPSPECIWIRTFDSFFDDPRVLPYRVATLTYEPSAPNFNQLQANPDSSYIIYENFLFLPPDSTVPAYIQSDVTSTSDATWGSIKTLFR